MTLGQRIQELRKQNNLSQEALGEKLGVSRQAISRWEMDGAVPEVDKLIAMGKLFGVSLNDLLQVESGSAEPEPKIVLALPRLWRIGVVVLALLTLLSLSGTAYLGWRLTGVEQQLSQLETQSVGLDPNIRLVGNFGWTFRGPYQMNVHLSPYQLLDDLEVTFQCTREYDSFTKTFEAVKDENGNYTAALYVQDMTPPYTVSAVFSDGTRKLFQNLVCITSVQDNLHTYQTLWDETNP